MGGAAGKLGGNLFSKYSNNFLGGGNWLQGS
jgi:hypothetical protein